MAECMDCGASLSAETAARHPPSGKPMRLCMLCWMARQRAMAKRGGRKPVPIQDRFMRHVMPVTESGCWIWMGKGQRYGHVSVGTIKGGDRRTALAHRVSWELFRGPIPAGMLLCHTCDVMCCVRPDHLFLGTDRDNAADAIRKGHRSWRGIRNPQSRFARRQRELRAAN